MAETRLRSVALGVALFLGGACSDARDVDYSRSRSISSDISATHEEGATTLRHGATTEGEPIGSIPWQFR